MNPFFSPLPSKSQENGTTVRILFSPFPFHSHARQAIRIGGARALVKINKENKNGTVVYAGRVKSAQYGKGQLDVCEIKQFSLCII